MKPVFLLFVATIFISSCAHRPASVLPPVPDAAELKFNEFFVSPVGPRGLALTEKLASFDGKRVRMVGYMVEQHGGLPGKFIFSPMPVQLHDHDSALADDLPPAVVHVTVPTCLGREIPFVPGPMLLTGILAVGHREEADGRMSLVRMELDPPKNFIHPRRHL
jgi:hypothetical protein